MIKPLSNPLFDVKFRNEVRQSIRVELNSRGVNTPIESFWQRLRPSRWKYLTSAEGYLFILMGPILLPMIAIVLLLVPYRLIKAVYKISATTSDIELKSLFVAACAMACLACSLVGCLSKLSPARGRLAALFPRIDDSLSRAVIRQSVICLILSFLVSLVFACSPIVRMVSPNIWLVIPFSILNALAITAIITILTRWTKPDFDNGALLNIILFILPMFLVAIASAGAEFNNSARVNATLGVPICWVGALYWFAIIKGISIAWLLLIPIFGLIAKGFVDFCSLITELPAENFYEFKVRATEQKLKAQARFKSRTGDETDSNQAAVELSRDAIAIENVLIEKSILHRIDQFHLEPSNWIHAWTRRLLGARKFELYYAPGSVRLNDQLIAACGFVLYLTISATIIYGYSGGTSAFALLGGIVLAVGLLTTFQRVDRHACCYYYPRSYFGFSMLLAKVSFRNLVLTAPGIAICLSTVVFFADLTLVEASLLFFGTVMTLLGCIGFVFPMFFPMARPVFRGLLLWFFSLLGTAMFCIAMLCLVMEGSPWVSVAFALQALLGGMFWLGYGLLFTKFRGDFHSIIPIQGMH